MSTAKQRGTCHSESGSAPSTAVRHSGCWNENIAPPQPLPVSPWQPGDWWDDVIVDTHTHTHGVMDAFAMNHGFGHYHLFGRAPSPRIPIGLTLLTFTRKCTPSPTSFSVHLLFFTLFWNKATVTQSLWEYQLGLNILSLKQSLSIAKPWKAGLPATGWIKAV